MLQSLTNNSGPYCSTPVSPILPQQLRVCRRTGSKLAKALKEKAATNKELQTANETIEQYKQQVYIITYLQINTSLILYQVDDMTEKMFNETQQREYVVKEKASIEERLKENDALRSQLGETKELLQQERLNV